MFEQRHQTVSTAKFVDAMRAVGINIGDKWSGLTIHVGLNATAVTWKGKGDAAQEPVVSVVDPVADKVAETDIEERPFKPAKGRTNSKSKSTSEDKPQ